MKPNVYRVRKPTRRRNPGDLAAKMLATIVDTPSLLRELVSDLKYE